MPGGTIARFCGGCPLGQSSPGPLHLSGQLSTMIPPAANWNKPDAQGCCSVILPPSLISLALLSHSHDNTVTLSHHVPTQVWVAEAVESLSHAAHPTPISNILQKSLGLLLPCCVALPADAGVVEVPTLTCDHEVSSSSLKEAASFLD